MCSQKLKTPVEDSPLGQLPQALTLAARPGVSKAVSISRETGNPDFHLNCPNFHNFYLKHGVIQKKKKKKGMPEGQNGL